MTERLEMPVPSKSRWERLLLSFLTVIVVVFSILSVYDLVTREAIIAPLLWICLVTYTIWEEVKLVGDCTKFAASFAGVFAGKEFIEVISPANNLTEIRFCIQIFGRRLIQWNLSAKRLVSVEWESGQATQMARRDMDDWCVCIWFKDDSRRKSRKPGQSLHIVGPSRSKQETERFGLSLVALLRLAGVDLKRDKEENRFTCLETTA